MTENQILTKKRWGTLFAACVINMMIGTGYAWSMFVTPLNDHFGGNAMGTLTWAFTLANSLAPIPMILGGYINDKFGPKWAIFVGGIFFGGGVFIAGNAVTPLMVVIGYGVIMGLGMGFIYSCTIGNSIKFFPDKAGMVGGLTTATYGLGSILLPLIIKNLIAPDTVLNTLKILGIVYLVVICTGSFFIKKAPVGFIPDGWEPPVKETNKSVESKNWKQMLSDSTFWVMMAMMMCGATMGLMLISNCRGIVTTAILGGGNTPEVITAAATTVTLLAMFNAVGRVACGSISDKIGRVNTITIMLLIGIAGLVILLMTGEGQLMMFRLGVALVGLSFGAFMGVYPGFCADQFGPANNSVNYGIMFSGFALAGIIGPKIMINFESPYHQAYMLAIGLAAVGLVMSFVYRALNRSGR